MPRKPTIPLEIHAEVQKLVDEFNKANFKQSNPIIRALFGKTRKPGYSARFKGGYLYLDRFDGVYTSPICRLAWNGKMDNWGFAIYKFSVGRYDSEEWFFPGANEVDGTVTGAMKAGMTAYPI